MTVLSNKKLSYKRLSYRWSLGRELSGRELSNLSVLITKQTVGFSLLVAACLGAGCSTSLSTKETVSGDLFNKQTESTRSQLANDPNNISQVRTSMAAQYIRENKLDAAKRQLERAFEANSRYAPAYDMMGILLQQEGSRLNLQKADGFFRRAIELDENFVQARNNYGVYLSQMNRYREAITQFEIAGSTLGYEGRISALENLGRTALKVGDKQMAIKAFTRALDGNRNSIIAHIELTDLFIEQNRLLQAKALYKETALLTGGVTSNPRLLMQGIKIAARENDKRTRQKLSQQLLSLYPLSEEAKLLKTWIRNPEATWK